MASAATSLDLGRLLRMQAMVTEAAQVEAVRDSAAALVHAYLGLRDEMLRILEPEDLTDLREEFERLFPILDEPEEFDVNFDTVGSHARLAGAATEAQMGLRKLQGWIQGLINELTLTERMRLEAEANARFANKPATGFGATS